MIATTGDISRFWHPFANMAGTMASGRVVFVSGQGAELVDSEGKRYFDASGGLWYNAVGHGRQQIVRAIAEQAEKLAAIFSAWAAIALAIRSRPWPTALYQRPPLASK